MPSNRSIDKEKMFRKIMPSAAAAQDAAKDAAESQTLPEIDAAPPESLVQEATATAMEPKAAPPDPYPINLAEILVEQYYPVYLAQLNGCTCQRCRDDVCGMALNNIRPRYIVSSRYTPDILIDKALVTETVSAIVRAFFLVKRKPHHDADQTMRYQTN